MIRFRFGHEDLVRTRFAISPLFDLTWSTDVLRDPAAHSLHHFVVGDRIPRRAIQSSHIRYRRHHSGLCSYRVYIPPKVA